MNLRPSLPASVATLLAGMSLHAAEPADRVALNGKVYTVNEELPWAEAIAVRGSDIVYVGDNAGAREFIGPDTVVGDLKGKLVLPGLVSGHEHPLLTAAVSVGLGIEFSGEEEKMLQAVADYIRDTPDKPRFSWGGAYEGHVEIYREDVDRITKEPFVMVAASGHGAWINSAALDALGVNLENDAPVDGFERRADGTPNGYLSTSAAACYALAELGLITKEAILEKLPEILAMYNSYGFTAVQDPGTPPGTESPIFAAVGELEEDGNLNLRISGSGIAQRPVHLEGAFAALAEGSPKFRSEMFTVNTLKMHGGSPDGYSAPLLEPYSDRPDYSGPEIFPYQVRLDACMKAAELGYNIHTHVMGDRSTREALDSFEAVRKAGYDKVRLSTGHSAMIHPDDQPRFVELDVTLNTYGSKNAVPSEVVASRIGEERLKYWMPNQTMAKLGTRISMSADAPTAALDPFLQIQVIMLRREVDETEQLMPEEGLTLEQAVEAYTMGAAYQVGWEKIIGSIEVGKRADLVVVSENIFELEPAEIHTARALLTMLNGQIVHEEAIDWGLSPDLLRQYDALGDYDIEARNER